MRVLIQRVRSAEVEVDGVIIGHIGRGLVAYLGVGATDEAGMAEAIVEKIVNLRIFEDAQGTLNLSVRDVGGEILAVSNFTLMADTRKGRRPSFAAAAVAATAEPMYDEFVAALSRYPLKVASGAFGCHMRIQSTADGPVNIIVERPPSAASADSGPSEEVVEGRGV